MAPELRDLLDRAAGEPRDLLPFDLVWKRSRRVTWRRRAGAVAGVAIVGLSALLVFRNLPLTASRPARPSPPPPVVQPLELGTLEPGRYSVEDFSAPFELLAGEPGWRAEISSRTWVMLVLDNVINLHVQRWGRVLDPDADPVRVGDIGDLPPDLAAWLRQHPRLAVVDSSSVTLGGLPGTRIDIEVADPLQALPTECVDPCVLLGLVKGEREPVDIEAGTRARFLVLDAPDGPVIVYFRAPVDSFDDVAARIERLISTVEFDRPA